ncbi:unnamed protein product [Closterium sp. NIES-53]
MAATPTLNRANNIVTRQPFALCTHLPLLEALTEALTPDQVKALLSLLQQHPASAIAAETTQPAASASAKNDIAKKEKGAKGPSTRRHDKEAVTSAPEATAVNNDSDDSDDDAGEAPNNATNFPPMENLPPLPCTNPTFSAANFIDPIVRAKVEPLEDLRSYLKHAEYKLQRGNAAGGLEMVASALDYISERYDMLQVEDATDDRVAKRFKMYKQKSLLTSRPFKQAVADVAAIDRAEGAHARSHRGGGRGPMAFNPKRGPPMGSFHGFRGTCFRCGQSGHVASGCPRNGNGGQGPAPVV